MPLAEAFVVIQVSRAARRKLKSLALLQEKPMYQVVEDLVDGCGVEEHAGLRRIIREEIDRAHQQEPSHVSSTTSAV